MTRGLLASLAQARADSDRQREEDARADATACTQEENLQAVALILDRLHDTASPVDELEPASLDYCDITTRTAYLTCQECDRRAIRGYILGAFRLCRHCATRRLTIAARLTELDPEPATATERAAA